MIQISKLIKPEIHVSGRLVIDGNLVISLLSFVFLSWKAMLAALTYHRKGHVHTYTHLEIGLGYR